MSKLVITLNKRVLQLNEFLFIHMRAEPSSKVFPLALDWLGSRLGISQEQLRQEASVLTDQTVGLKQESKLHRRLLSIFSASFNSESRINAEVVSVAPEDYHLLQQANHYALTVFETGDRDFAFEYADAFHNLPIAVQWWAGGRKKYSQEYFSKLIKLYGPQIDPAFIKGLTKWHTVGKSRSSQFFG